MALTHISLENITIEHLQQLIDGKSNESRYIDYKKGTYVKADDKTKSDKIHIEFLKDISSFANSDGGDIIIGMTETKGVPESFCSFNGDADKERLRLEQMVRSGLKPQIFNLQTRQIPYGTSVKNEPFCRHLKLYWEVFNLFFIFRLAVA